MRNIFLCSFVAIFLILGCSDPVKPDVELSSGVDESSSSQVKVSSSVVASSTSQPKSSSSVVASSSSQPISSSSVVASSSSQPKSSSSVVASSSSQPKSSSCVVASSSSQPKSSSSSSYETQDDIPFGGRSIYDSIYDPRDGHKYLYKTFVDEYTGLTIQAMAQNLDYSEVITLGAEEQDDDTKVEKYCYNDIPQHCDFFGGLYQWAEMMALPYECNLQSCADSIKEQHQGICPEGWLLITNEEMWAVINSTDESIEGVKSQAYWAIGGGRNTSGFTLLGGGGRFQGDAYKDLYRVAYWYFPTEYDKNLSRAGGGFISGNEGTFAIDNAYNPKVDAFSVRCVKNY